MTDNSKPQDNGPKTDHLGTPLFVKCPHCMSDISRHCLAASVQFILTEPPQLLLLSPIVCPNTRCGRPLIFLPRVSPVHVPGAVSVDLTKLHS